jgi:spore coat polysaccharide biosynthesis predicted glycosyltransferase SpsG
LSEIRSKRFIFRVDAGGSVGLGHFYRSVNLAGVLARLGHVVIFIHQPSAFWTEVETGNFPFACITLTNYSDEEEYKLVISEKAHVFYVDGILEFDPAMIILIKQHASVVFYQNLSQSRGLADVFILPSFHQPASFFNLFDSNTIIYQGTEYQIFKEKIVNLSPKQSSDRVKHIAITTGGSDPRNTMKMIYNRLDFLRFRKLSFTFFYGTDFQHMDNLVDNPPLGIDFFPYDEERILDCDILISCFGVSTYEFMALGMPVISFGHQISNANASAYVAQHYNGLIDLGLIDGLTFDNLNNVLDTLIIDRTLRSTLSEKAKQVVDFHGVNRIVEIIESL